MAKINISINDELLSKIERLAEDNYMSRSGLISVACAQYVNQNEVVIAIKNMAVCMKKIADNKTVDDETMEQLKDFERISKLFVS